MAKDFRADQIRFHTIIASGTKWPDGNAGSGANAGVNLRHPRLGMFVCSSSVTLNSAGEFNTAGSDTFSAFGHEPWLVFSGVANTQDKWNYPDVGAGYPKGSAVLFMGDVIISGTLFGKRQVITVDKDVDGDFHVNDSAFISGNFYSSPTTYGADISDVLSIQRGDNSQAPKVGFRKTNYNTRTAASWLGTHKDSFVVFSGSKGTRGLDYGGIGLFEGDLHISGNLSVGGTWGSHSRDTILNNSASAPSDGAGPNVALARGKFPHDWQNLPATADDPVTSAGPSFGHATTASAGGTSLAPFYVEQDRWQVHASQATKLHNGNAIPAFWYSDFVNSSSLDAPGNGAANAKHLGGFRFIVAGSGSGVDGYDYKRGRGNKLYSSVFTISGSGDIAIDPGKAVVFDSRMQNGAVPGDPEGWRRVQIKHVMTAGTGKNSQLIFSGSQGTPLHYQFVRGEVTGSGGFYLPAGDQLATQVPEVQGQMGQTLGLQFAGHGTKNRGDAAAFYQTGSKQNNEFPAPPPGLIITASNVAANIKIGAGDSIYTRARNSIHIEPNTGIYLRAGYWNTPTQAGKIHFEATAGEYLFSNRGNIKAGNYWEKSETVFEIKHNLNSAGDLNGAGGGYTVQLNSSGSGGVNSYLMMSGSGVAGAHTIKTVDGGGTNADLTIFPDGALIMSGTGNVSIDTHHTPSGGTVTIGGGVAGQTIQVGGNSVTHATKAQVHANEIELSAGAAGLDFDSAGGIDIRSSAGNTVIATTAGTTDIIGIGVGSAKMSIYTTDTTNGIEIGLDTPVSAVPVFIGGRASTVTIGNDLSVGTLAHSGSVDVWGDMTVHGTFIKGHIITASMQDPLLFLNSGSLTANSGGGIAISSGSHETWKNGSEATFTPALVFGRDTTTSLDTFLVGRMDTGDGDAINLVGSQPIDIRAAGYRTVAGMTMTASKQPGASVYNVKVGNTGSAGQLTLHAGTLDGSAALGMMVFSGSNFAFNNTGAQKVYLDQANNVYFQADQGTNRLDFNLASDGARLTGVTPQLEFGTSNYSISKTAAAPSSLLLKASGQTIAFSGSDYSFDLSSSEQLYFKEGTDAVSWKIDSNTLELDLAGSMTGLKLTDATNVYFASANKFINGTGQTSDGPLTYKTDDTILIKSHGGGTFQQPSRVTVAATGYGVSDEPGAGNGGILITSGTSTAAGAKNGYMSIGYNSIELDAGDVFTGTRSDVTVIFSGSASQFPAKTTRGTTLFMGDVVFSGSMAVGEYIYHDGNEDATSGAPQTALKLQDRGIKLIASGTTIAHADAAGSVKSFNINPDNGAVSFQANAKGVNPPIFTAAAHDSTNRAIFHNTFDVLSPHLNPANGDDVLLFFSGSVGSKYEAGDDDPAVRATALFGGDVYVSGALGAGEFNLANLTLTDTSAYLRFYDANHYVQKTGTNLMFRDDALGTAKSLTQLASLAVSDDLFSVTRTAVGVPNYGMSTGSFSFDSGWGGYSANNPRPTNLVSFNNTGAGNSDVYFFVSGTIGMRAREPVDIANPLNRRSVALFGGDVHISGTITSDNTSFGGSLNAAYDTSDGGATVAGGGKTIIADAGYIEIKKTASLPIADSKLFGVTGSASFGQIKIAPIADANGFYTNGGVFVTGSAGQLGFGVGGSALANMAMSINNNNNLMMHSDSGNSRKISWDGAEASTFIRFTNTNGSNPGPKILHFANRNTNGRISLSMGASGTTTGAGQGTGFEGHLAVSGSIVPGFDSEYNLGSPSHRWANVYTGDLHLKNDRGNWTIYEEPDMLVVVNNLTGKRYKMGLTPLEDNE